MNKTFLMTDLRTTYVKNEVFEDALKIRYEVFCGEQNVPVDCERDEIDDSAVHVVLYECGKPKACGRVYFIDNLAKLGRVAVLKNERRKGYATLVCGELLKIAFERGAESVFLHSQLSAEEFYKSLGFETEGEIFYEPGNIPHIKMVKVL